MKNKENISASQMLEMLREMIFMSIDTDESDQLSEAFNNIFLQISYLERCYNAKTHKN